MLLHSSFEPPGAGELTLELYSSESGLAALGLGEGARERLEQRLARYFDGARIYPAESGHELYREQLGEYFEGRRRVFELPLDLRGSAFQLEVWNEVARIPYGQTASYGEIAELLGKPGASRAVGSANHHNPVPIVVPCHRVIGSDGELVGFGAGLPLKRRLLALEGLLPPPEVQMRLF